MVKLPYWHFPTYSNSPTDFLVRYLFSLTGVKTAIIALFKTHKPPVGKWLLTPYNIKLGHTIASAGEFLYV